MKRILILLVAILLFSGCVAQNTGNNTGNQRTVKNGDNVSVDYVGSVNGKVFDSSIESVGKENNFSHRTYQPMRFVVGKGQIIPGFEEGIIGMKVGESRTLTIPPEKAYQKDPRLIHTVPILEKVPVIRIIPKVFEIPGDQFNTIFGAGHKIGDSVKVPNSNVNLTILKINTTSNVSVSYNLAVGSNISAGAPWNDTVIKIDDKNITLKSGAKKNDIFKIGNVPWNSTVIDVDSVNITVRHNKIPEIKSGSSRIYFNDTDIIIDQNNELAGETLVFNVTIKSID